MTWRERFARCLDRLFPRACWSTLWDWGQRRDELTLRDAVRPNPVCARDVERIGSCWCGKNQASTKVRSVFERPAASGPKEDDRA